MAPPWLTQEKFLEKSDKKGILIVVPDDASAQKMLKMLEVINQQLKNDSWFFLNFEGKSDIGYIPVFFMKPSLFDPEADERIQVVPLGASIPKLVGVEALDKTEVSRLILRMQTIEKKEIKEENPDSQSFQGDKLR